MDANKDSLQVLEHTIFEQVQSEKLRTRLADVTPLLEQIKLAIALVARLRGPQGCPWDREQDHLTIRPYLIEEAYEVLDVLDTYTAQKNPKELAKTVDHSQEVPHNGYFSKENSHALCEELGDLLLQILLHSQISWERGDFHFGDVAEAMTRKLVSRHPHVFGEVNVSGSEQVLSNWEALKKKEGKKKMLDGLPKNLPSLQRAARIGEKAHRVGFDWRQVGDVWKKVEEEFHELQEALDQNNPQAIEHELGDLFFSLSNLGRWLKIQPEDAHRKAINRFEERFSKVEEYFEQNKKDIHKATDAELDEAWVWAKKELK